MSYYLVKDLNVVGKIEGSVSYLHDPSKGWVVDNDAILMDRIMGYDGESIGCMSMLERVDEISEQEALALIQ
ncbi:MAG TPA: hypothetical protein VN608_03825 [Clostridia bacterium]|nr:hypothetical protein [Clostridia bacterium]